MGEEVRLPPFAGAGRIKERTCGKAASRDGTPLPERVGEEERAWEGDRAAGARAERAAGAAGACEARGFCGGGSGEVMGRGRTGSE